MTKLFFILTFFVALTTFSTVKAESYVANDLAVEQAFQNSSEITANSSMMTNMMATASSASTAQFRGGDKSAVIAFLLAFIIGELGIHRFYMGTATLTGVGYILTMGGCGIVATVDWIVLLIALVGDGDISKYVDNSKFFMW